MPYKIRQLSRRWVNNLRTLKTHLSTAAHPISTTTNHHRTPKNPQTPPTTTTTTHSHHFHFLGILETARSLHSVTAPLDPTPPPPVFFQNLLKFRRDKPADQVERALDRCGFDLSDDLVIDVLKRHRSDWRPALVFFNWVSESGPKRNGYSPSSRVCNEMIDILGKMKRFEELHQVLDEMSKREGVIDEGVFGTLIRR